jgi:hypothetical protein
MCYVITHPLFFKKKIGIGLNWVVLNILKDMFKLLKYIFNF